MRWWYGLIVLLIVAGCSTNSVPTPVGSAEAVQPIRIGWQVPWATQGQLVQVMKRTNVLALNDLEGDFHGFSFGAPLNEAALAGDVDVLFTADQPAATLLSKSDDFVIIGRLMYNRVSIYVPPSSPIQTMADLKGETLALPFGAAVQREALRGLKEAGLDPGRDVTIVNLDLSEQAALVSKSTSDRWDGIAALGGFDPTPAIFQAQGLVRFIQTTNVVAVVVVRKSALAGNMWAPRFMAALAESWMFFNGNRDRVNTWYKEDANFSFAGQEPLLISASVEPNTTATTIKDIRLTFDAQDQTVMQEAADFLFQNGLIDQPIKMIDHVDTSVVAGLRVTDVDAAAVREQ